MRDGPAPNFKRDDLERTYFDDHGLWVEFKEGHKTFTSLDGSVQEIWLATTDGYAIARYHADGTVETNVLSADGSMTTFIHPRSDGGESTPAGVNPPPQTDGDPPDAGLKDRLNPELPDLGRFDPGFPNLSGALGRTRVPGAARFYDPTPHVDREGAADEPRRLAVLGADRLKYPSTPSAAVLEEDESPLFGRGLVHRNYGRVDPLPSSNDSASEAPAVAPRPAPRGASNSGIRGSRR